MKTLLKELKRKAKDFIDDKSDDITSFLNISFSRHKKIICTLMLNYLCEVNEALLMQFVVATQENGDLRTIIEKQQRLQYISKILFCMSA